MTKVQGKSRLADLKEHLSSDDDFLRTEDYFFRYDHGVTNVHPSSLVGRLFLGKLLGSAQLLRLAQRFGRLLPKHAPPVTVDVFIPFAHLTDFMRWYGPSYGHFPLWCVPYRLMREYEWVSPALFEGLREPLFIDLAVYGMPQHPGRNDYRLMEEELQRVQGIKTLISHNFYSREEFWSIWNKDNYDRVKQRLDPHGVFGDLYEKTCTRREGVTRRARTLAG